MALPESVEKQVESMEIHLGDQGKTLSINLKVVKGDVPIDAMTGKIATHFPEKDAVKRWPWCLVQVTRNMGLRDLIGFVDCILY